MHTLKARETFKLSIVIPCFNEARTLQQCVEKVLQIADNTLQLEIIIVDDFSTDESNMIADNLAKKHAGISVLHHEENQGKGAALRTGIQKASGDFVAIQDADLEYEPMELKRLLEPLTKGQADVVFGSRFLSYGFHRVLYFWHSLGNHFLTFLSNMFTDLNLTDMEACYKVFRRDVIQSIQIEENRFGFEPEIVAKVAQMRLRIYEMGISYQGRTYAEGKKIKMKDGFRALYCIFRYNAHKAPIPVQFMIYLFIGGLAAIVNLFVFLGMFSAGLNIAISAPAAFIIAAVVNYFLCILLLFKRNIKWNSAPETLLYCLLVGAVAFLDLGITKSLLAAGISPAPSKFIATGFALTFNFIGRRFLIFPEPSIGPWKE